MRRMRKANHRRFCSSSSAGNNHEQQILHLRPSMSRQHEDNRHSYSSHKLKVSLPIILLLLSLISIKGCTSFVTSANSNNIIHRPNRAAALRRDSHNNMEACKGVPCRTAANTRLYKAASTPSDDATGASPPSSGIRDKLSSGISDGPAPNNPLSGTEQSRRDILNIGTHLLGCLTTAALISTYEDYDVTHLKPNRATLRQSYLAGDALLGGAATSGAGAMNGSSSPTMIGSATRGLAWNQSDRRPELYEYQFGQQAGREIPSYNEVMERHRNERVVMWRDRQYGGGKEGARYGYGGGGYDYGGANTKTTSSVSEEMVKSSVVSIYDAIRTILRLKILASDYQWEEMTTILNSPILTSELERATSTLRSARSYLSDDDRRETIGFDWGSCAWRHCGAAADAQESLAEIRARIGLYEPFECLFILDIVERSLRDIVAVVPDKLKPTGEEGKFEDYVPYVARSEEEGNFEGDGDESDFLGALSALRNDLFSFGS